LQTRTRTITKIYPRLLDEIPHAIAIYARENISEYWAVEVLGRKLIVYRSPEAGEYQQTLERSARETISPLAFPDIEIAIAQIFAV
jgi:Uma2 family endonuclease